jgi:hypothetical protein
MLSKQTTTTVTLALLFLVISSPLTYKIVNNTLTKPVLRTDIVEAGVPTRTGLILHTLVFALLAHFIVVKARC